MASPWSSVIPVQPSAGMIQSELHYMASIRYPILTHPLALDRVFMLLSKAREAASRMSFQWVRLRTPKNGECFLMVRTSEIGQRPVDGYAWNPEPNIITKAIAGQTVELAKFTAFEHVEKPIARLEYRLVLPNNRLTFVHYIALSAVQDPSDLIQGSIPQMALPDNTKLPIQNQQAGMGPTLRPPHKSSIAALPNTGLKASSAQRPPAARKVQQAMQTTTPRPPAEELLEMMNDVNGSVDTLERALSRIRVRHAELYIISAKPLPKFTPSLACGNPAEEIKADTIDRLETDIEELQRIMERNCKEFKRIRSDQSRIIEKVINSTESLSDLTELLKEWAQVSGLGTVRKVAPVSRLE